jgi:hypothetical protein
MNYVKLKILSVEAILPFHIIIIAQKFQIFNNQDILNEFLYKKFKSPFLSDKS